MITHLYRFRPLARVLGGELSNQQIYFAKPEHLNDPMEGFRDIYWRGDAIVWDNLLRHFVLCVERAFSLFMILGEQASLHWGMIPVFNHGDTSVTPQQKVTHDEILNAFFAEECVKGFVAALATRAQPVRRAELAAHFRCIHPLIIVLIQDCYRRQGMIAAPTLPLEFLNGLRQQIMNGTAAIDAIRKMEENGGAQIEFQIDMFYTAQLKTLVEMDLIHLYNGAINPKEKNRNFVFVTFCDEFVQKIETLVYPAWYTACFMEGCRNSSVWGSYGQNHTAVCLKFKVKNVSDRPSLPLFGRSGSSSGGPADHHVNHPFYPITYGNEHLPVDFFGSLGRLPIPVLTRYWYGDGKGNFSRCGDAILKDQDAWRKGYWEGFYHAIARKLKDWEYEREHRLLISGEFSDYDDDESCTFKYDFNNLDGIVFGIKTPIDAKLEIFKTIEEKCRAAGRKDFKFYQAFYARATGTIEQVELGFLKFKF